MTTVTLGHPETILHAAAAAAVVRVLEAYDLEVEYVTGSQDELTAAMKAGGIDLFVSAWLPDVDARWLDPSLGMDVLGELYKPVFGWFMPEGCAPDVASIADLGRDDGVVNRNIVAPESALERVRLGVGAYGLTERGFTIEARPDEEAYQHAAKAIEAGEASILPLWQPHFLHHGGRLRPLEDPRNVLAGEQAARMLVRREARAELDSDLLDELDELMLGHKVVSALEYAVRCDGMSTDEAAEAWQRGKLLPR
ncbi:glycine betaine ABC transporter substrate-binding protein [Gluconacetobacter asukensis]|uniref:Glycine/betaine ABC transporter n=1 Tax=Gluconacetobacter asukensis TaxID=1017181 RepID=A0A7W4J071_9PROT|nr:glycine betaine ABC transporter substrate-binding protein [Gluconacetobacter asukensis]MBB2172308.1 glycine/betaine ABC transporter [Gluconacetobacter asukensis]